MRRWPAASLALFVGIILLLCCGSLALAQSPLQVVTTQLPDGYEGDTYSATLTATGGKPPYSWSMLSGSYAGLALSPSGVLSGTTNTYADGYFIALVTDSAGTVVRGDVRLFIKERVRVRPACYGCLWRYGAVKDEFADGFTASGGYPPYKWSLVSGSELPPGVTMKDGWISGTPTSTGLYLAGAAAADASGHKDYVLFFIYINSGVQITSKTDLVEATVGRPYTVQLHAESTAPPCTWSVASGQVPDGLILSSSGTLSGTPRVGGAYTIGAQAMDSKQRTATQTLKLFVISGMEIVTTTLEAAKIGQPYQQALRAAGGSPGYRWTLLSGALPKGLRLTEQGELTGTPVESGAFAIELKATDEGGQTSTRKLMLRVLDTLTLNPAALQFTFDGAKPAPGAQTVSVASETAGVAYSATVVTTSGGSWLSATPRQGVTPASLNVNVNPVGLSNGDYSGVIYLTSEGASNSPLTLRVSLTVTGVKTNVTLLNGASFAPSPSPVAPGSIAAVFGEGIPETASFSVLANADAPSAGAPLPSKLDSVEVKINDIAAPLFFAGAGGAIGAAPGRFQVNLQIPPNTATGAATLQVFYRDTLVATTVFNVASAAPGVFALGQGGTGQAAVINQDGSLNGDPAKPVVLGTQPKQAPANSVITVYATGAGSDLRDYATGGPATPAAGVPAPCDGSTLYVTKSKPTVTIGGKAADVTFSGLAPCYVGLWQLNIRVPTGLAAGVDLPLVVTMDQQTGNATSVAVK